MKTKPCTECGGKMICHTATSPSLDQQLHIYHFLDCSVCGYGPQQAYESAYEAITHWNQQPEPELVEA